MQGALAQGVVLAVLAVGEEEWDDRVDDDGQGGVFAHAADIAGSLLVKPIMCLPIVGCGDVEQGPQSLDVRGLQDGAQQVCGLLHECGELGQSDGGEVGRSHAQELPNGCGQRCQVVLAGEGAVFALELAGVDVPERAFVKHACLPKQEGFDLE